MLHAIMIYYQNEKTGLATIARLTIRPKVYPLRHVAWVHDQLVYSGRTVNYQKIYRYYTFNP